MRRPPVLIASAGVVVVVLGAVLVFVLGPAPRKGSLPLTGGSAAPPRPPSLLPAGQRSTIPVLLVHGYTGGPSQMEPMAGRLRRDGRTVKLVELPRRGTVDLQLSALTIALTAREMRAPVIDFVGYSLGGVAARQWFLFRDPVVRVRHLVMLATPNYGVRLPDTSGAPDQAHCEPNNACGQLAPGSPFLRALDNSPLARGRKGWLTVASETDQLVRPPSVVALAGAKNLVLQRVCPGSDVDHGEMNDATPILGLVALFLDDRLPSDPTCSEATEAAQASAG